VNGQVAGVIRVSVPFTVDLSARRKPSSLLTTYAQPNSESLGVSGNRTIGCHRLGIFVSPRRGLWATTTHRTQSTTKRFSKHSMR
jgi:hypothetical protein